MSDIIIKGAKTHNLKNIDVNIPRDKLVVITGLSGSGKSSLAFDTLYAEGQRRYVESLSAYARQFLSMMEKPDVDLIEGLSPAISIEQKATSHNPRSTVGTITEIYDYLRLLYARVGTPFCPEHKTTKLSAQTVSQIVDSLCSLEQGTKINLLAPVVINQKGEFVELFKKYMANGYVRALVNGEKIELSDPPKLQKHYKHNISVIVDRVKIKEGIEQRLAESIEHIIEMSDGLIHVSIEGDEKESKTLVFSTKYACVECGFSAPTLEPRNFSFNNPIGACQSCNGLGVDQYFDPNKIITDHSLTIAQGAIRGWDSRKFFYFSMLKSLADHFNFDIDEPYQDLSEDTKNKILYGTGDEDIHFHYVNSQGSSYTRTNPFEGVVPNMQRRFRETDSNLVRDELSKCLSTRPCKSCDGDRLGPLARNVKIDNITLPEIANMSIAESYNIFNIIKLEGNEKEIADKISKEIKDRLSFLMNVGLNYLSLSRSAETLSGGESQRIRLASQIGSGLVGVMYILDEPSIGLHQRDNDKLLETLFRLRDLGNTVIVVEHDEDAIKQSDYLIDMGPKAGVHGGNIVASGTPSEVMNNPNSITGMYMSGKKQIEIPQKLNQYDKNQVLKISDATLNNLKNISAEIPLGLFTCVTGVSGSGKSSLINDTLYPLVKSHVLRSKLAKKISGKLSLFISPIATPPPL
jgi:excinuclease ABC subunit A